MSSKIFITLPALLFYLLVSSQEQMQGNVFIKGTFENPPDSARVVFSTFDRNFNALSTTLKNGSFAFVINIPAPTLGYVRIESYKKQIPNVNKNGYEKDKFSSNKDLLALFIEAGNIIIQASDSLSVAVVKGSVSHEEWEKLSAKVSPIRSYLVQYGDQYRYRSNMFKDTTGRTAYNNSFDSGMQAIRDLQIQFVKDNPNSYVSLHCLNELSGLMSEYSFIHPLFERLSERIKNSVGGKKLAERLSIAGRTQPGFAFTDFTQQTVDGSLFQLSSLKGKYTLVDFWAAWCLPCREESPNLVAAYKKYHPQGLEIVSVSLDTNKIAWTNAIEKDDLVWHHVSDLKG